MILVARCTLVNDGENGLQETQQGFARPLKAQQKQSRRPERRRGVPYGMARRWKLLVALGAALVALGLIPDWPPRTDPALPEPGTFFLLLGVVVGMAGVAIGLRQEK